MHMHAHSLLPALPPPCPAPRATECRRPLSQFKDEVQRLGLQMNRQPVPPALLGKLFDEIDTDGSGFLDLKEAKAALKKWQGWSGEAYSEQTAKEGELARLKAYAASEAHAAPRAQLIALRAQSPL